MGISKVLTVTILLTVAIILISYIVQEKLSLSLLCIGDTKRK